MEGESALQVFAEVSVALAGFTGVVAVFRERGRNAWSPVDRIRFRAMLGTSVATLMLSLLPFGLHDIGLSAEGLWATSSAALALYVLAGVAFDLRRVRTTRARQDPKFDPRIPVLLMPVHATVAVLQVLNILSLGFQREVGPFLLGLFLLVGVSGLMFVLLLSSVHQTEGG